MNTTELKETIKKELPKLLKEDKSFSDFVLQVTKGVYADKEKTEDRIERILEELRRDREEQNRKWEEQNSRWEEQNRRWEDQNRRLEEQNRRWEEQTRKWEEQNSRWEEQNRRWEDQNRRLEEQNRRWEEQTRKWEEQNSRWEEQNRRWEEQTRKWEEQNSRWEEQNRRWEENNKRLQEIHAIILAQAKKYDRSIGALGARWGIKSEHSFRNALAGILEENFDIKVITYRDFDETGEVFGRPEQIELDIIIKNGLLIICEQKSSMSINDMYIFERKARFYEKRHQRKADTFLVISPMVDNKAMEVAKKLGIKVYSDSSEVTSFEET